MAKRKKTTTVVESPAPAPAAAPTAGPGSWRIAAPGGRSTAPVGLAAGGGWLSWAACPGRRLHC